MDLANRTRQGERQVKQDLHDDLAQRRKDLGFWRSADPLFRRAGPGEGRAKRAWWRAGGTVWQAPTRCGSESGRRDQEKE